MSRLRQSAEGETCTLQFFNICNHRVETTVLCHIRMPGTGMGMKPPDWQGVYGCSACHDHMDRRDLHLADLNEIKAAVLPAFIRTLSRMFEKGLLRED